MKKNYLKSFCARCLTLLILALLSTNLAWGAEGDTHSVENVSFSKLLNNSASIDDLTITNPGYPVKEVVLNCKYNKTAGGVTISITIGGEIFGTTQTLNQDATKDLKFTGDAKSGDIVISFKNNCGSGTGKGTFYLNSVTLTEGATTSSKTLTSIAISGTPKTTYEIGESFDVTGLTVIGTYDDTSTDDLTNKAEWTINPAKFTSTDQTSVQVTATISGKSDSKNYNVTVSEHVVTPGTYDIVPNNTFWGNTQNGSVNVSKETSFGPVVQNDITISMNSGTSTNSYINPTSCRVYGGYTFTIAVPSGFEITTIEFTGSTWAKPTANVGSIDNQNSKKWTGNAQTVTFTFSGTSYMTNIKVTYAAAKTISGITVKNAPTKTTYYVGDEFDPAGLVITASYDDESTEDIAYTEDNKDAFSFSGFNSEEVATDQEIMVTYAEKSATFNVDIKSARTLQSIYVSTNPDKMEYEVGEALDLTGLVIKGQFSEGEDEEVEYTADPADGTTLDAEGTTTVTLTSVDNTELTTSFNVTVKAIEGDRLTLASTGVSGSSYAEWSGKTGSEGVAVYAGKCAGGNSSIQLNTSNPQGIVSTTSGGLIRKVKVDWNSNTSTTGNRSIDIYGSNTAYTGSGDIYNTEKQGTKLGSIVCGTSTELEVEGYYEYVGIRAIGGALYMNSITFIWEEPRTQDVEITSAKYATLGLPYAVTIPEDVSAYTATVEGTTVKMTKIQTGKIPANCGVILYAEAGDYTFTETTDVDAITGNQLVAVVSGPYTCTGEDVGKVYYLGKDGEKATFKKLNENGTIAAGKAYLKLENALDANVKLEVTFGEPTGIESLTPALSEGKGVYNLNGLKVNEAYKGIVIMNGKKYINK